MPSYWIEKCLQGSYSLCHTKYGQTARIQCACNTLVAICWRRVRKLSCWRVCDLGHVLDIADDLYKTLGLHGPLDASDLPDQISLDGYLFHINKLFLHDGEAVIGRRFLLNLFQNMNAALLFVNSTFICKYHCNNLCFSCILLF